MRFAKTIIRITDNIVERVMETDEIKKSDFIEELIDEVTEAVMDEINRALEGDDDEDEESEEEDEERVLDMRRIGEDLDDKEFGIE